MTRGRVVVALLPAATIAHPVGAAPRAGQVPARNAGWTGIAIDVLRATSTLTVARANGAVAIVPFADPDEARRYRDAHEHVLACGERASRILPGFDLGNSPSEYDRGRVAGKTLAFASTNGSFAMLDLAGCDRRWLGAFVNASAVVRACTTAPRIRITCAGKEGGPCEEDAACAGWIASRLAECGFELDPGEAARLAAEAPRDEAEIERVVRESEHGRYLATLGEAYERDVTFCAGLDRLSEAYEF